MAYLSEAHTTQHRRRRRRQRITMGVIVLLVIALGAGSFGYFRGWFGGGSTATVYPPCPPPTAGPITAKQVTVNVYNSTSRNGLAAAVAKALKERAYVVENVANDPLHTAVAGTALVRHGVLGRQAAVLVAAQVPGAKIIEDNRAGPEVDLVLGPKFVALGPKSTPTTAATPTTSSTPSPAPSRCTPSSPQVSGTPPGTAPPTTPTTASGPPATGRSSSRSG